MKKIALLFGVILVFCAMDAAFADNFDSLEGLTAVQKQKLTQIQYNYKQQNDSLDNKIMDYNNKLQQLQNDKDKTSSQISLLSSAYERNLETLKAQQKQLKQETDASYKSVMTDEQFKQYQAQQINVDDSFNKFLQK
ncbi:MAG: hypothetical protein LUH05_05330 [Candidatus Gastranaerophilales bacterium]|nr:hypothetical protein [Candidatus Gastranaerophilales bacterium]